MLAILPALGVAHLIYMSNPEEKMNDQDKPWSMKHRLLDLMPVLH